MRDITSRASDLPVIVQTSTNLARIVAMWRVLLTFKSRLHGGEEKRLSRSHVDDFTRTYRIIDRRCMRSTAARGHAARVAVAIEFSPRALLPALVVPVVARPCASWSGGSVTAASRQLQSIAVGAGSSPARPRTRWWRPRRCGMSS